MFVPTSQIPVGAGLIDEMVDRGAQIVDPALQREVALARPAAAEREGHRHPAELVGDPVDQLGKRSGTLAGIERADREPVTEDQSGQWPVPPGRTRQVPSEDEVAGLELAVHRVLITLSAHALGLRWRRTSPGRANSYPRLRASTNVSGPKQSPVSASTMSSITLGSVHESRS